LSRLAVVVPVALLEHDAPLQPTLTDVLSYSMPRVGP
jgi:hypothetical protein